MKTLLKLLRKIIRLSPLKFDKKLFRRGPGRPPNSGLPEYKHIGLTKPDYILVKGWARARGITMRMTVHELIESFILCKEQDHIKIIQRLTTDRALFCDELARYIKCFGKIPPGEQT